MTAIADVLITPVEGQPQMWMSTALEQTVSSVAFNMKVSVADYMPLARVKGWEV